MVLEMNKIRSLKNEEKAIFWYFVVYIFVVPVLSIFPFIFSANESLRTILTDIIYPLINLMTTFALFFAALHSKKLSKRLHWGWVFVATAQFSFTIGDIFWMSIYYLQKSPPFPSIADLMYLLYYPLFFLGIVLLSGSRLDLKELKKRTLDLLIVFFTATLVYWIFLINPIIHQHDGITLIALIISLAYPIGDLILLFGLLMWFYNRFSYLSIGSVFCMCLGIMVIILSDSIYSHQILTGTYENGGILEFGWKLSFYLLGLSALFQIFFNTTKNEKFLISEKFGKLREIVILLASLFPYLSVVFSYILLLIYYDASFLLDTNVVSIGVGCIMVFVITRQIIILNENKKLLESVNLSLQKVGEQAFELDQATIELFRQN